MPIDQQKLTKEFVYAGRGTAAELLAGLDQITQLEAKLKRKPVRIRWASLAAFVIFAVLTFILGPLFALLAIIVPIGLLIYSAFVGPPPILHDRIELLRLSLNTLNQDAGKKSRFDVLMPLCSRKQLISEGPNPRKAGGKQLLYKDPWLTLSGRLGDGTSISQTFVELIRERTKRNARGKTKRKGLRRATVRLQMTYNPAIYGDASVASSRLRAPIRLPSGVQLKSMNATNTSLAVKALTKSDVSAKILNSTSEAMLLGAYRVLNLARRGAAVTGGAK